MKRDMETDLETFIKIYEKSFHKKKREGSLPPSFRINLSDLLALN
jgi:hypothetical protein